MIEKKLAAEMMRAILEANNLLVQAVVDLEEGTDQRLSKQVKRHIAGAMGIHLVSIMDPIGALYPDLYPEALRPAPKLRLYTKKEPPKKAVTTKRKRSST